MIRLLNVITLRLESFEDEHTPPYAIASHRWRPDEATYKDFAKSRRMESLGTRKVQQFCSFVRKERPLWLKLFSTSLLYLWMDTCCINRSDITEVNEAINQMFNWYAGAHVCLSYLFDIEEEDDMTTSAWFERGWTLQELIAPPLVVFLDSSWTILGHKQDVNLVLEAQLVNESPAQAATNSDSAYLGPNLNHRLSARTGVPVQVISDLSTIEEYTFDTKLAWMQERFTSKQEDQAYCLLGIFDVNLVVNYGERERATIRLLEQIQSRLERKLKYAAHHLEDPNLSSARLATIATQSLKVQSVLADLRFQDDTRRDRRVSTEETRHWLGRRRKLNEPKLDTTDRTAVHPRLKSCRVVPTPAMIRNLERRLDDHSREESEALTPSRLHNRTTPIETHQRAARVSCTDVVIRRSGESAGSASFARPPRASLPISDDSEEAQVAASYEQSPLSRTVSMSMLNRPNRLHDARVGAWNTSSTPSSTLTRNALVEKRPRRSSVLSPSQDQAVVQSIDEAYPIATMLEHIRERQHERQPERIPEQRSDSLNQQVGRLDILPPIAVPPIDGQEMHAIAQMRRASVKSVADGSDQGWHDVADSAADSPAAEMMWDGSFGMLVISATGRPHYQSTPGYGFWNPVTEWEDRHPEA